MGNKIVNARVDTPTENTHIPNKIYVDTATKYDTVKANQFSASPKFSWMQSLKDKTFKELFDMLFFPVIAPIYTEPFLESLKIKFPENQLLDNGFYQLFYGQTIPFSINCKFMDEDRESSEFARIVVHYSDDSELSFYGTATNGEDTITGNMPIKEGMTVFIDRAYMATTITKNDNYGNPSTPIEFTLPSVFSEDLTSKIFGDTNVSESVLVGPFDETLIQIFPEGASFMFETLNSDNGFTKTCSLNFGPSAQYLILIPKELYDRSNILVLYNGSQENLVKSWLYSATITVDGIEYIFCNMDFGAFKDQTTAKLIFQDNS